MNLRSRLRALSAVIVLLCLTGGLPGIASPAGAQERIVRVAVSDIPPMISTSNGLRSGFEIDILEEIAKRENWTLQYVGQPTDSVMTLLEDVTSGRADAAAAAISITADRTKMLDFSQPTLNAGLQIMVPQGHSERSNPGLREFLKLLFSRTMLIWLTAALFLAVLPAHIIWISERGHANSMVSKSYFPGIFQAFTWGMGMLAGQPDDMPRHWVARAFSVLWAFVGIIFVAYYTATLTANLTVEKFNSQISTPSDLFGKNVCTKADTTSGGELRSLGIGFTGVKLIEDCFAGLQNHTYDAVVFDAPVLQFYVAHDGSGIASLAGPVFQAEDYGVAFRYGSELRKEFDQALLSMREDGAYDLVKQKWFGSDSANSGG